MNGVIIWIKANYKKIGIILFIIFCVIWIIWSGWNNYNSSIRLRGIETNLANLGAVISSQDSSIRELQSDYNRIAEISSKWEAGLGKLDQISRAIEAGNRRSEEIYRGLTGSITSLKGGFSSIESDLNKLSADLKGFGTAEGSDLELIRQALEILNGVH